MASNRVTHKTVKLVSLLPVYITIVATMTLILIVFGFPFLRGY